jgi:hypothetical protein
MKDPQRKIGNRPSNSSQLRHPVTPDGRYFVAHGKLWRRANPALPEHERARLVSELIRARCTVGHARRSGDAQAESAALREVERIRVALGQRGAPWWADGGADLHRRPAQETLYREWFSTLKRD